MYTGGSYGSATTACQTAPAPNAIVYCSPAYSSAPGGNIYVDSGLTTQWYNSGGSFYFYLTKGAQSWACQVGSGSATIYSTTDCSTIPSHTPSITPSMTPSIIVYNMYTGGSYGSATTACQTAPTPNAIVYCSPAYSSAPGGNIYVDSGLTTQWYNSGGSFYFYLTKGAQSWACQVGSGSATIYSTTDCSTIPSNTPSISTSATPSITPSISITPTPSRTPSITPSLSLSRTPSITPSKLANPTCSASTSTPGWSISLSTCSVTPADTQAYYQFTMSGMPFPGPNTVIWSIWDGSSYIGSEKLTNVRNGVQISNWFNISPYTIQYGRNYNLSIDSFA